MVVQTSMGTGPNTHGPKKKSEKKCKRKGETLDKGGAQERKRIGPLKQKETGPRKG